MLHIIFKMFVYIAYKFSGLGKQERLTGAQK